MGREEWYAHGVQGMYRIEFSPESVDNLRFLTARQQREALDAIKEQLIYQPEVETRDRKPMRPNPIAPWELRIGNLRVYCRIERSTVRVAAIGIKDRNEVRIGKEVVEI